MPLALASPSCTPSKLSPSWARRVAPLRRQPCHARQGRAQLQCRAVAEVYKSTSGEEHEVSALLCQKFKAHTSAVSAALVLDDSDASKQLITASLDKSLALWASTGSCNELCGDGYLQAARLAPPGGPVFSLAVDSRSQDGMPDQVYCGNHAKQVVVWVPPKPQLEPNVVLEDHCGWVRSVAVAPGGRWLFSAACNVLRQWDMSRAVPRCVNTVTLDKGDILCMVASKDRIYAANADGSIRCWQIGKKGELSEVAVRAKAHKDRITALALRKTFLYSVSYDGSLKAWDAASLELVMCAPGAHDGQRLHALVVGPDKVLYTGGDDQLVRRWNPALLEPAAPPLFCHNHPVRALAAGRNHMVVSGDKGGELAVWKVA